jgi:hypothetical protein
MADRAIRIDRLQVRLHGATAEAGARLGDGLRAKLAPRIAAETTGASPVRSSITRLAVTVPHGTGALDGRVADAIARAVAERLTRGANDPGEGRR